VDDLIQLLRPLTEHLPQAWQDYLSNGGWPVVLGVAGVILLLVVERDDLKLLLARRPARVRQIARSSSGPVANVQLPGARKSLIQMRSRMPSNNKQQDYTRPRQARRANRR